MRRSCAKLAALALAVCFLLAALTGCNGMAASIWLGRDSHRSYQTYSYYYSAPYAFIEGHRLYVYWDFHRSYVRYWGDIYYITIYSDGRVEAPYSLIILLR